MKHIRILILALVLCLVALPASAQGRQPSPRAPQGREAGEFAPGARPSHHSGSNAVSEDELLSAMETLLSGLCERGVITEDDMTAILAAIGDEETVSTDSADAASEQTDETAAESDSRTPPARRGRGRMKPSSDSNTEAATETESANEAQSESALDSGTLLALVENGMLTQQEYETLVSD